jgi:hypothetical protein
MHAERRVVRLRRHSTDDRLIRAAGPLGRVDGRGGSCRGPLRLRRVAGRRGDRLGRERVRRRSIARRPTPAARVRSHRRGSRLGHGRGPGACAGCASRRSESPAATPWIAAMSSSGRVRLSRNPEGPALSAPDVVVLLERRQDDDLRVGRRGEHLARGRDPVETGHANVHEHDVRTQRDGPVDAGARRTPRRRLRSRRRWRGSPGRCCICTAGRYARNRRRGTSAGGIRPPPAGGPAGSTAQKELRRTEPVRRRTARRDRYRTRPARVRTRRDRAPSARA